MDGAVTVNGRAYRLPAEPCLVVCLDGVDPSYLEDAFGRAPSREHLSHAESAVLDVVGGPPPAT